MLELLCNALIGADDGVEGVADFSRDPNLRTRQADGEIPRLHCAEHVEQLIQVEFRTAIRRACAVSVVVLFSAGDARAYVHDKSPRDKRAKCISNSGSHPAQILANAT